MRILLTNDDGIYARGLAAMEAALKSLGEVMVVAPSSEQSGVSQSITFLRPLVGHEVFDHGEKRGYAVDGTPADCVKLGVMKYSASPPDLIVSGINGGLNAGLNILYSGTVGGAMEGALFGVKSIAVSLEWATYPDFERAAELAIGLIRRILDEQLMTSNLLNINIPTSALEPNADAEVCVVPMETRRIGHSFVERTDPKNRTYYWPMDDPHPEPADEETDVLALKRGAITLTPLTFELTQRESLRNLQQKF